MNFIIIGIIAIILIIIVAIHRRSYVWDFGWVHSAKPAMIYTPTTEDDLIRLVTRYPSQPICLAGGRYSHGGQTMLDQALYIDMTHYNRITQFDPQRRLVTVQTGIT